MTPQTGRWTITGTHIADDWSLEHVTPPSRLYGANGLRTGADGRIYVAQVPGSQISAIDISTGDIEIISAMGSDIVAPDDIAFDDNGNMYITELTEDRVSVREKSGNTRVIQGDIECANPITVYQGRLFSGECKPDARIMELPLDGGNPRVLIENVPLVNAFEVGPDGLLYFPVMGANEIWRISLDGGEPEVVAKDLGVPDSVKFDRDGFIISTQVASGQVLRIDPRTGEKTVLASLNPGLDNCTFVDDRLFVSNINGSINEVLLNGSTENNIRALIPDGLQWPMGLAVTEDGTLLIMDGGFVYTLKPNTSDKPQCVGMLYSPGFPGFSRGVISVGNNEWVVTTANGDVARFWPAEMRSEVITGGYDRLMDLAFTRNGSIVFAEYGTGIVYATNGSETTRLASDLDKPSGIAVANDDTIYVSERGNGKITKITHGKVDTFVDDLINPQGMVIEGDTLYVVDTGSKSLLAIDTNNGSQTTLASQLPVGAPTGITPKPLMSVGTLSGPMTDFCGLTRGADGTLYLSGDAEGSVLALRAKN